MIYLRNLAARRTVAIPLAVGWHRLLRPAVTSAVPELLLPAVRKLLARKLVAHVDTLVAGTPTNASDGLSALVWPIWCYAPSRRLSTGCFSQCGSVLAADSPGPTNSAPICGHRNGRNGSGSAGRAAGATGREIAAEMGVTPGAVSAKARREGLKWRGRTRGDRATI